MVRIYGQLHNAYWTRAGEKAFDGKRKIHWKEIYAGEKANAKTGEWLPNDTTDTIKEHLVAIKGPLTTPVGGGFRSLNVAIRQILDLYACVRPVKWYRGVPSPVKKAWIGGHGHLQREYRRYICRN